MITRRTVGVLCTLHSTRSTHFTSARRETTPCNYAVRTCGRMDERTHIALSRAREWESCEGRMTCVSPASFVFYPFCSSFSFLCPCLPEEKERKKGTRGRERERERERANKPLRRAFSRSVVKGKGAIAESLPCRVVSIQQSEEKEREKEDKRDRGLDTSARKISDFFLANFKRTHLLDPERVRRIAAKVSFASKKRTVKIEERWV